MLDPRATRENAETMRNDCCDTFFTNKVVNYVRQIIADARRRELDRFLALAKYGRHAEVYMQCGYWDLAERKELAELDPVKLAIEYESLPENADDGRTPILNIGEWTRSLYWGVED